jgi:hypothetical protein
VINFTTTSGKKFYTHATRSLSETHYDLSSSGLKLFLDSVQDRIIEQSWSAIFTIPVGGVNHSMTSEFGQMTIANVRAHHNGYIGLANRNGQNSYMSYVAIMASLSDSAKTRVSIKKDEYILNDLGSGPLLLRTIISLAYVVNKGTTIHLREQLTRLNVKIAELDYDVVAFNQHVSTITTKLASFGEHTLDLVSNLFTGYEAIQDEGFSDWIKRKRNTFEEDNINMTAEDLMAAAQDKYSFLVDKGRWNQPSQSEERIIALEATIESRIAKAIQADRKDRKGTNDKSPAKKAPPSNKWTTKPKAVNKYKEPWLFIGPKKGESDTLVKKDKTFYWCKFHKKWTINGSHTSDLCTGHGLTGKDKVFFDSEHAGNANDAPSPKLCFQKAVAKVVLLTEADESDGSTP